MSNRAIKMSFFHDSRFLRSPDGKHYTTGTLNSALFERRYLQFADELKIVARLEEADEKTVAQYTTVDHPSLSFNGVGALHLSSLSLGRGKKIIQQALNASDFAVIRLPSLVGLVAAREAVKIKKPFLIELVGCAFDAMWNYGTWIHKLAAKPLMEATKRAVSEAPYVIYVTKEFLQRRYPTKGNWISCSNVVLHPSHQNVYSNRARKIDTSRNKRKFTIGTLGNVSVKYKGHEDVIKAIPALKNHGFDVDYQLVGGGDPGRLEQLARRLGVEQHVTFRGVLEHHEVFDWLDSLDIYAQLSLTEGLPRGLIEAMSRGCACIGTKVGGIPELLREADLIRPQDSDRFVQRTVALIENPLMRKAAALYGVEKSEEYWDSKLHERRSSFIYSALVESDLIPAS